MSLFSKKPKSIADFEKEIEKLRQKKKLSARNSERLEGVCEEKSVNVDLL